MKNSKLIAMFLTFIVMIAITPFIFGKLMNSKFDKMLDNLRKEGIVIKELKSKSTYLTTDRVFEVEIPQNVIDNKDIKVVKLKVESVFKNLPVTDVKFFGKVKEIVFNTLNDAENAEFNDAIKDKIKFLVTTPNFKVYEYKFDDTTIDFKDGSKIGYSGLKGVYQYYKTRKNSFSLEKAFFNQDGVLFQANNVRVKYSNEPEKSESSAKFDLILKDSNKAISIKNISTDTISTFKDKLSSISKISIQEVNLLNKLFLKQISLEFDVKGIDKNAYENIAKKAKPDENDLLELVKKGFSLKADLKISKITAQNKDYGFLNLFAKLNVKPETNIEEKIKTNNLDFVTFELDLKTTAEVSALIMNMVPQSVFLFMGAEKNNGILTLQITFKNNEVFLNGQKIK